MCDDLKQAVNTQIDVEQNPLLTEEALIHIISRGMQLSK